LQEKIFARLFDAAEIAKSTPDERDNYEASLKYYQDLKNVIDTAIAEGGLKGKTEGRMIGIIEGKKEGLIEGKIEIARNAIAENIPPDIIIRLTGLTVEELEKLKDE
jgi:predicted transposase/invertase (TIGR01784 family)